MIRDALERVGLRPGTPWPVPASAERRPAAALDGGARVAHPAEGFARGRTGLDGRRLTSRDHPGRAAPAARGPGGRDPVRDARPDHGVQLCRTIVVLYRGAVVEQGTVDEVIGRPEHPYTQLLVSSIPRVHGEQRWLDARAGENAQPGRESTGCRFAARCPAVMDRCWKEPPPLYRTEGGSLARCFLYDGRPQVESEVAGRELVSAAGPARVPSQNSDSREVTHGAAADR